MLQRVLALSLECLHASNWYVALNTNAVEAKGKDFGHKLKMAPGGLEGPPKWLNPRNPRGRWQDAVLNTTFLTSWRRERKMSGGPLSRGVRPLFASNVCTKFSRSRS